MRERSRVKGSAEVYDGHVWKRTFRSVWRWIWDLWSVPCSAMVRGVHCVVSEPLLLPADVSRAVGSLDPGKCEVREYEGIRHESGASLWMKNSRRW